jgi:hypothetical protein
MRLEWRWPAAAILALLVGAFGAQRYVQLAAPCYRAAAVWLASGRPWTITRVDVAEDAARPGVFVRLHGEVRRNSASARPAATCIGRVQAGAAIEGPLLFWAVLFAWPATVRRLGAMLLMGLPVFFGLEIATTVCQLMNGFAEASAIIGGDPDPLTGWERWSRFLESGGRDVLAVCAALLTVAGARRLLPTDAGRSAPSTRPATHTPTLEPVRRSSCPVLSRTPGLAEPPAPN